MVYSQRNPDSQTWGFFAKPFFKNPKKKFFIQTYSIFFRKKTNTNK